ncbi:hypothetical protein ACTQ4K_00635 [Clostridium sporogenes]|uniref:hypothetical protein n=1 Tax=Clostridium sporogenes TaxID=1509 RepID=UPI003F911D7B
MDKELSNSGIHPKNILIQVTEVGKPQTNVRIPFFVVRAGMKIGQAVSARKTAKYGNELDMLKDIDMDAILSSLNNDELTLPCLLVDVEDSENERHVKITLE